MKDGLCLTTIPRLLAIITPLPLGSQTILALLILGNFVRGVLFALLVLAVCLLNLGNVHLTSKDKKKSDGDPTFHRITTIEYYPNVLLT